MGKDVPVGDASCLLLSTVPDTGKNNKSRLAGGLKDTEKGSNYEQAGKVGAGGVAG
jgi:hypothetical protein